MNGPQNSFLGIGLVRNPDSNKGSPQYNRFPLEPIDVVRTHTNISKDKIHPKFPCYKGKGQVLPPMIFDPLHPQFDHRQRCRLIGQGMGSFLKLPLIFFLRLPFVRPSILDNRFHIHHNSHSQEPIDHIRRSTYTCNHTLGSP